MTNDDGEKQMKQSATGRQFLKLALLFLGLLSVLTGGLCLSATIPRASIAPQIERSLDKLENISLFEPLIGNMDFSKQDNYADIILLNILYNVDTDHPLASVLSSEYVGDDQTGADENLRAALNGALPDTSYARYWHGSMLFLRPLLSVFDLQQIRLINAVILALLFCGVLAMLCRRRLFACAGAFFLAAAVNALWLVPVSLEYTPTVLLAMLMCLLIPCIQKRGAHALTALFLTAGILTSFFDFLTTETLPALLPLILLAALRYYDGERPSFRKLAAETLRLLLAFAVGYAVMWASKWALAALVPGIDIIGDVMSSVSERTLGSVESALGGIGMNRFYGAIIRNLYGLFPMLLSKTYDQVLWISCAMAAVLASAFYLLRRDIQSKKPVILLLLSLSAVPYLRFLALSNHALIHYFFTYRAQTSTVFALLMILVIAARQSEQPHANASPKRKKRR